MYKIPGRALHYVFKIGDRAKNAHFFRNILGMKVLRHEEFQTGCAAQCNGPYDNRWSKTMVGYGAESSNFVIELTYNYGVSSYELGNDFGGISIKSNDIIKRATAFNYPIAKEEHTHNVLCSPDGYKFNIITEAHTDEAIQQLTLHVTDLERSKKYWHEVLQMQLIAANDNEVLLTYGDQQPILRLMKINDTIKRAQAFGRIAFAVPKYLQEPIDATIRNINGTILTPLLTLDTPGKAAVRVIIIADPDGHEICYVDEEGYAELSQIELNADKELNKYIAMDPFQTK